MDGSGEGRRYYRITAENQGAKVLVAAYILTVQTLLSIIARASVKLATARTWALDDTVITASALVAIGHTVCMVLAYNNGLGSRLPSAGEVQIRRLAQSTYASNILYFAGITLAKISIIIFVKRLTPSFRARRLCWAFLTIIALWGAASMFSSALACGLPDPWLFKTDREQCIDVGVFVRVETVIDIVTDYLLVALTIRLFVWKVTMHPADRMTVFAVFSIRAVILIPNILRIRAARVAFEESPLADINWNIVPVQVWTVVSLHFSIITASVPCVRPFLRSLESGLLSSSLRLHPILERAYGDAEKKAVLMTLGGWRIAEDKHNHTSSSSSNQNRHLQRSSSSSQGVERAREGSVASDVAFWQRLHPEQSEFKASIQASRTFPQFPRSSVHVNKSNEHSWESIAVKKETQIKYEQDGQVLQELRTEETFVGSST